MTILVPSHWLENLVKKSFLGDYPIEVRYNTIDTTVFQPTPGNFREEYGLADKKIILGVASVWTDRKGLPDFLMLRRLLDERYAIVLVGLTEAQIAGLPAGILGLPRTHDARALAEIYTAADAYVNPSREETFGLTVLEAVSCGTPAIVYRGTACEEVVNRYAGIAVDPNPEAIAGALGMLFR